MSHFFSKLHWTIRFSKWMGLHVFRRNGRFSVWKLLVSISILTLACLVTIPLTLVMSYLRWQEYTFGNLGLVAGLIDLARILLVICSLYVHLVMTTIRRKTFGKMYKSRIIVQSDVHGLGSICYAVSVLFIRIGLLIFMLIKTAEILRRYLNCVLNILMALGSFGVFLVIFQFGAILETFKHRMDILTRQLSMSVSQNDDGIQDSRRMIEIIREHAYLVRLMSLVNVLFGYQILAGVTFAFTESTVDMYYILVTAIMGSMKRKLRHILYMVQCSLTGLFLAQFLYVVASSTTESQASVDAFYKELFRLMGKRKALCNNKKLCLYVSMRKTVNFTACGFFNLGYPLITSIIAAATTYLVILVQFSIPKSN